MTKTRSGFDVPELRRLRYFHGQLLGARDLQREQEYFREKLKLRMRCLLGYGVVCGLVVDAGATGPATDDDAVRAGAAEEAGPTGDAADVGQGDAEADAEAAALSGGPEHRRARVRLAPGLGVDACGNEIVVRHGCEVDLFEALADADRDALRTGGRTLWIGVQYDETPVEPTRTVFTSDCGDTSDCEPGWTREGFKVRVTARRPDRDERCDTCCEDCGEHPGEHPGHDGGPGGHPGDGCAAPVLWLARIDDVRWHRPVRRHDIDNSVRRPFGRHVPTVITGINWVHGATYTVREAKELLGTTDESGGLVVEFSDDVRADSLRRGVVDVQVIEGGAGKNADSWFMGGEFAEGGDGEFTRRVRYRQTTRETLQDDDRVMITIRTAFLLDRCCRPVDGTHVGGRVPLIDRRRHGGGEPPAGCPVPPSGVGPWTSGTGVGGDVFESWFFVREG